MEFFHISGRKLNLRLLKGKKWIYWMQWLHSMGSSSFRSGCIWRIPIISPGPGFSLHPAPLPFPLVWLHPDTLSAGGDEMTAGRMLLFQGLKRLSLHPARVLGATSISSLIFVIFLQFPLNLICFYFSSFLRCQFQSLIWDFPAFTVQVSGAINFPLSTALVASHEFNLLYFHLHSAQNTV